MQCMFFTNAECSLFETGSQIRRSVYQIVRIASEQMNEPLV